MEHRTLDDRGLVAGEFDEWSFLPDLAGKVAFDDDLRVLGDVDVDCPATHDFDRASLQRAGGVTVVTSTDKGGAPIGMTATAVCSLSATPPTLLVCANRSGAIARNLGCGGHFCVNLLSAEQADIARVCVGGSSQRENNKFDDAQWSQDDFGIPSLTTALARFHCVAADRIPIATHILFVGRVNSVCLNENGGAALAYREGKYLSLA